MSTPLSAEDLSDFKFVVRDTVQRAGMTMYLVRASVQRDGAWEVVGFLELSGHEWQRLYATVHAHGGAIGLTAHEVRA